MLFAYFFSLFLEFWSIICLMVFTARRYASMVYAVACVCLSVCLSVTSQYCTNKDDRHNTSGDSPLTWTPFLLFSQQCQSMEGNLKDQHQPWKISCWLYPFLSFNWLLREGKGHYTIFVGCPMPLVPILKKADLNKRWELVVVLYGLYWITEL